MRKDQVKFLARLGLWGGVVFLTVLLYFDANPIPFESSIPELVSQSPPDQKTGEVLLVTRNTTITKASMGGSFKTMDWSYAWLNTVEQEIGPYSVIDEPQLHTTDLTPFRIIILTHSIASSGGDPDLVTRLKTFSNSGGVLVIERPEGELRKAFAADGKGGRRQPKVITNIKDLGQPFDSHLKSMPLNTTYVGSSGPLDGATTWLAMDGVPVIYSRPSMRGHVIIVDFNYGLLMTSLQQGRPRDDFSVANRYPDTLSPILTSSDLVTDERMLDNSVPYSDLFEKFMVGHVFGHARPVVGLWPFKNMAQGAVLITHNDETMGDAAAWMASWEKERGVTSTYFLSPNENITPEGIKELKSNVDIQLQWILPHSEHGIGKEVGFWDFNPLVRALSLDAQREELGTLTGDKSAIYSNRNHQLLWRDNYCGVFRQLAAEGIKIDSSYGPGEGSRGYLFGTSLPFFPIDPSTGFPFALLEIPFLTAENFGGVDMQFMHTLFLDSYEHYHESINVLFRPNAYQWTPSVELFDLWLATYDLADDYNHWTTTISSFGRFWRQRREANLKTSITVGRGEKSDQTKSKKDHSKPPEGYDPGPITIKIEAQVAEDGHSAYVPAAIRGRRLRDARRGLAEGEVNKGTRVNIGFSDVVGRRVHLLPLKKGHNTITAYYH